MNKNLLNYIHMKKLIPFFLLTFLIVLNGCQNPKITCKITAPYNGQSVLWSNERVVIIEVEATKSTVTDVVVSYYNLFSSTVPYSIVLTTEPYSVVIPPLTLPLGKNTITAVATNSEGTKAESKVTINVVEKIEPNEIESSDFVTFTDGIFPGGWMTYSWDPVTTVGFDDTFSLKSANPFATVFTKKTLHAPAYIQFYTQGKNIDLYIDDTLAHAFSVVPEGSWNKSIYTLDSGKHAFRWQTEGALKYLDAVSFFYD